MKSGNAFKKAMAFFCLLFLCSSFFSVQVSAESTEYDSSRPDILEPEHLNCSAAILIELDSGEVIFEKNADARMYPASTTKILTAYLGLTMTELDQTCVVSNTAVAVPDDSSKVGLAVGEEVNYLELIYATMLASGNDGANVIAETVSGSIDAFVELMNLAADAFGCTDTHFANAHGYHDENHYTTARDMALIARTAMKNETMRQIVSSKTSTLSRDNVFRERTVTNTNRMISDSADSSNYYEYATGMKTGQHSAAGYCLVGTATRDGVSLLSVVFNATDDRSRYSDTKKLLNYGFTQFISTSIAEIYAMNPKVIDISGFSLNDRNVGKLELALKKVDSLVPDLIVTTQNNLEYWVRNFNDLTITEFTHVFRAPIVQGEVMGTLTYYPENSSPVVFELVAARTVEARDELAPTIEQIIAETENDPNPFPRFSAKVFIKFFLLPIVGIYLLIKLIRRMLHKKTKRPVRRSVLKPRERYYR